MLIQPTIPPVVVVAVEMHVLLSTRYEPYGFLVGCFICKIRTIDDIDVWMYIHYTYYSDECKRPDMCPFHALSAFAVQCTDGMREHRTLHTYRTLHAIRSVRLWGATVNHFPDKCFIAVQWNYTTNSEKKTPYTSDDTDATLNELQRYRAWSSLSTAPVARTSTNYTFARMPSTSALRMPLMLQIPRQRQVYNVMWVLWSEYFAKSGSGGGFMRLFRIWYVCRFVLRRALRWFCNSSCNIAMLLLDVLAPAG